MVKVEIFPRPTIHRMLDLSIYLLLHMPKEGLSIPEIGEHTLQAVDHR
jgi:hypothetical protein